MAERWPPPLIEPEITINGTRLTFGQAMTVRVAIENFALFISELSAEERAGTMNNYEARINELREYYMANQPKRKPIKVAGAS